MSIHQDESGYDGDTDHAGQYSPVSDAPRPDQQYGADDAQWPPQQHSDDPRPMRPGDREGIAHGAALRPVVGQDTTNISGQSMDGIVRLRGVGGTIDRNGRLTHDVSAPVDRAISESHRTPPPVASSVPGLGIPNFLRDQRPIPTRGLRRLVWLLSGKRYVPRLSSAEAHERAVHEAVRVPLNGRHRIATVSVKGGSGKTTTTVLLGSVLAAERGDRVVAVDANPDAGNLARRLGATNQATVRDLVDHAAEITSSTVVREYTSQSASRLEVLASDQDPEISEVYSEQDYRSTIDVLGRFYNIILTDSGTGLLHASMPGVLDLAQTLIIVVGGMRVDGAEAADKTAKWLEAHGYGPLVRNGIAVVSNVRPGASGIDHEKVIDYFRDRCRMVVEIPFDEHIDVGGVLDLDQLAPETRAAVQLLAAAVAEAF